MILKSSQAALLQIGAKCGQAPLLFAGLAATVTYLSDALTPLKLLGILSVPTIRAWSRGRKLPTPILDLAVRLAITVSNWAKDYHAQFHKRLMTFQNDLIGKLDIEAKSTQSQTVTAMHLRP